MKETYIKLPLATIPFSEIKLLEDVKLESINCSYIPLKEFNGTDKCLMTVYSPHMDSFDKDKMLFGRVLSELPQTRGKSKVMKVGQAERVIEKQNLPHLKYSNNNDKETGNWFYAKDGNYFIFSTFKSTYDKVSHLEGISIYADNILRLRIVIELLKERMNEQQIKLSMDDLRSIAFSVLRSDPLNSCLSDHDILDGVTNWLPAMLDVPRFEDIPVDLREKAKS